MADSEAGTTAIEASDLSSLTIGASIRDVQTVTPKGEATERLIEGVKLHPVVTHIDDRGSLVEMFDPRWSFDDVPLVYAYSFSIRPGRTKGWALHKLHVDRYFNLQGEVEVVLYDVRPESQTCGRINRIRMSEFNRGLLSIPAFVWHATRNLASENFVAVNFPTRPFDHANPDKYRLPLDTPLIPYSFETTPGW